MLRKFMSALNKLTFVCHWNKCNIVFFQHSDFFNIKRTIYCLLGYSQLQYFNQLHESIKLFLMPKLKRDNMITAILVTGCTRGLGRELAKNLASKGCRVWLCNIKVSYAAFRMVLKIVFSQLFSQSLLAIAALTCKMQCTP